MTKALVTGGAGFIGSHLVQALLLRDISVVVLDNFSTGRPENLGRVKNHPRIEFYQADITQTKELQKYFQGVDWVFHLAALADIVPSIEKPMDYYRANVTGTISVLEASRDAKVKRFIYAASSSCYGIPKQYPTPESALLQPQYPYALTKRLGEEIVLHWSQVYGLPALSLRFFNVFGPRARTSGTYGAVFGVFLAQKMAGKPFTVVGDGTQTRDFTFVDDVVDAMILSASSNLSHEIFNVGSGGTYSVNQLVKLLGGKVVYIPKRPGEPECTFADTTKISSRLGWKPKTSFEQGVAIMLEHLEDWRHAPVWDEKSIADATRGWFQYLGQTQEPLNAVEN